MYQKQNELAMNGENRTKTYLIETKPCTRFPLAMIAREKRELKNAPQSRNVIENTCRKNVRFMPLHDVDENTQVKRVSPRC
jgi:hypothetical protein